MRVSELYGPVPQGEGALLGEPMPFLRLAGCNLSCSWCDSAYTWQRGYAYSEMSVEQVLAQLVPLLEETGCRWVSITGGEPTIYAREVTDLCLKLFERGVHCTVETNGLRQIAAFTLSSVFVSCSPKPAAPRRSKTPACSQARKRS